MSDADNRGDCACVGAEGYGKIFVHSQFCCKPKTTLKKQSIKKINEWP